MIRVQKLSHATYEIPDVSEQADYFANVIGLSRFDGNRHEVFLTGTVDHHSVVLRRGDHPICSSLGMQISPETSLDEFERQVQSHGVSTSRRSDAAPLVQDMVVFDDPKGTSIEVFHAPQILPKPAQRTGIVPSKLGHVAFHVSDVKKTTAFYCDVLGFRVSDWLGDAFSFLRCNADHHSINLMQGAQDRHFHSAFELQDWNHIQRACEALSQSGYRIIWGPGRHGIGHNIFTYHKSPSGLVTELFVELDQMSNEENGFFDPRPWHRDTPQRPKVWPKGPDAANLWGVPPPEELLKA